VCAPCAGMSSHRERSSPSASPESDADLRAVLADDQPAREIPAGLQPTATRVVRGRQVVEYQGVDARRCGHLAYVVDRGV
jgi:hypothetical protein